MKVMLFWLFKSLWCACPCSVLKIYWKQNLLICIHIMKWICVSIFLGSRIWTNSYQTDTTVVNLISGAQYLITQSKEHLRVRVDWEGTCAFLFPFIFSWMSYLHYRGMKSYKFKQIPFLSSFMQLAIWV